MHHHITVTTAALIALASTAAGQVTAPSLGQPARWEPYAAPSAARGEARWAGQFAAGVHRPLTHPVTGLLGVSGELYSNIDRWQPGARLMATSRALGLSFGLDWQRAEPTVGVMSFQTAVRRGGLLGHGTMLRLDWRPAGRDALALGLHVPFATRAGRTRPRNTDVDERVGSAPPGLTHGDVPLAAATAMQDVARAATMILAYTNLFAEDTNRVRYGESFAAATRSYGGSLDRAFAAAVGDSLAPRVVRRARRGLLDLVILPYDSLFGQVKEHPSSIRPLTATAHARFRSWLRDSAATSGASLDAAMAVHGRWMTIVEAVHANLLAQWRDSRLVWLPLQLALTEDQYDEQAEVDALIERAVGHPFTDRNALTYLRSHDLPLEIARSILVAREYHVLWTHDFTGQRDGTKTLDEIGYTMVSDAYLPALIRAVQRYDSTRTMPLFTIVIDQFYYEQRNARLWMNILENPLWASMKLPGNNDAREKYLLDRQMELRRAMDGSRFIRPEQIKVHVHVVQRADWSFRSHRILPPLPFVPDHFMRDHRKLVFYDLTEEDPYRGGMIVMGVGIGEHYATATWEDRGYRVRGPAALEARLALRQTLMRQGIAESDIPAPLRVRGCDGAPAACDAATSTSYDYVGRALHVHNEAGFGPKESSVARAMLYNLAPAGSVVIVPDPIWVSRTWASMLAAAAARGARVHVIAPAKANNPNPHGPIEAAERDVVLRLIQIRDRLAPQLRRTGGELRVGLYHARARVTDAPGRLREIREGLERAPWIRRLIPFDDRTLAVLDRAVAVTESDGRDVTDIAEDETPRAPMLHQKTQLIARPGAIESLVREPGWEDVLSEAMRVQSRQSSEFARQLGALRPDVDSIATRGVDALLRTYEQSLSERDREDFSFYFSLGTQNQDPRGIMMDGEATVLVSGLQASVGLVDLYYLMARSEWIETRAQLDALLPDPGPMARRLARLLRNAL